MHNDKQWTVMVVIAVVALTGWLIAGCGGGGGTTPANTGSVSGSTVDIASQFGIGGLTVTVGGQQDVTDGNGNFAVTGVLPSIREVVVTPTSLWEPVNDPPEVTVVAGQTTPVGVILVREFNTGPPPPPIIP